PVELGAEFVHGDLPHTLSLLKEAGIPYYKINDTMFRLEKGKWKKQEEFTDDWDELMKQMKNLQQDMTLSEFLDKYFAADKYKSLRTSVEGFAGGFDLADAETASVKSLYKEWTNEMENQYRIDGGYKSLVEYLATQSTNNGCVIERDYCVQKIDWQENGVVVTDQRGRVFKGDKAVIAVPVSVLQADKNNDNFIAFAPAVSTHQEAARNVGFGNVVKLLIEFDNNFWNDQVKNAGFFLTNETIPTWWTLSPENSNALTGWVGAEKTTLLKLKSDEEILGVALQSLSSAFNMSLDDLQSNLKAYAVANWSKENYINGGYSFNTIASTDAKRILQQPIANTIFFAGEALFEGTPGGTVEAAIASARHTVGQVLQVIK
ncbi:MAG TPA: NAD(P)/FAD-dependent oxidoreductase, partial [Flavitalea sp.]|nr:NAD(P)/FAD-dependent oxidoreductase [Flavitalea sp.]